MKGVGRSKLKILDFILRTVGPTEGEYLGPIYFFKILRSLQLCMENGLEGDKSRSEAAPAGTLVAHEGSRDGVKWADSGVHCFLCAHLYWAYTHFTLTTVSIYGETKHRG